MEAELFIQSGNMLGEGPVWDDTKKELLWVDIERKMLCFYNLNNGDVCEFEMDSRIGAAVPIDNSDDYLLALQSGLKIFNRKKGGFQLIAKPEENIPNNRFNDGKCDPAGRFWIGSMDLGVKKGAGNLYCLDSDLKLNHKLNDLTISNGLAWSSDLQKMYFIDTSTYSVTQFDYDLKTSAISNPLTVVQVPEKHGAPDGMCIDSEGMLWIAHWGGGNVSRWNPANGELLQKVDVPAPHVTSCCFGGEKLDTLYITTAKTGLTETQLKEFPFSGSVFQVKLGGKGSKVNFFKMN